MNFEKIISTADNNLSLYGYKKHNTASKKYQRGTEINIILQNMSVSSSHMALFLFLFSCVLCLAAFPPPAAAATVHVMNNLPKGSPQLNVRCNGPTSGADPNRAALFPGSELKFTTRLGSNVVYYCDATWELKIGAWHGVEPGRDANHEDVYWDVREQGFLLSYDKLSWKQIEYWQTE